MSQEDTLQPGRPLRLLTIAALDRNPLGGAAGTLISCNQALRALGHQVDEVWNDSLPARRIHHQNLHSLLEKPRSFAKIVAATEVDYDAILVNEAHGFRIPTMLRAKGKKTAVITVSQGIEKRIDPILSYWRRRLKATKQEARRSFFSPAMSWLLNRHWDKAAKSCDGFMVVNEDDRKFLVERQDVEFHRIHLWKSGLDPAFHASPVPITPERLRRLIYVGQTAFYKHPGLVVEVVSAILQSDEAVRFTWITQAEHHAGLLSRFPAEIRPRIKFLPWMDQSSLIKQLDEHGIMLFPTIVEGFGRAALEAMSRGVCVVASRSSGMKDYIQDGVNGLLCEVGETKAFVRSLKRISGSSMLAEMISRNAIQTAAVYTWERVAEDLVLHLKQIIGLRANEGCLLPE
jgi:glycosyltransferase involved in cell wall biosynthesis